MTKVNIALLAFLVLCALSVVTSQHRARKLFVELQSQQERAARLEDEWGQLQLEQRTWSTATRIEKIAATSLRMRMPTSADVRSLPDVRQAQTDSGSVPEIAQSQVDLHTVPASRQTRPGGRGPSDVQRSPAAVAR